MKEFFGRKLDKKKFFVRSFKLRVNSAQVN